MAELSLDFISMTKIYSRCSYWILLIFLWPRQGHMAILKYWGFWEIKYLTFIFIYFFRCGPFLKSLLNWLQHCSCLMFFWPQGMWDLSSRKRIESTPLWLVGKVLATGPPGNSQKYLTFDSKRRRRQGRRKGKCGLGDLAKVYDM